MRDTVSTKSDLKKGKENIDNHLKLLFVRYAQQKRLMVGYEGSKRDVANYNEIEIYFQKDGSKRNCANIYSAIIHKFISNKDHERHIESDVMCDLNFCYSDELPTFKGSIARMVTTWKV